MYDLNKDPTLMMGNTKSLKNAAESKRDRNKPKIAIKFNQFTKTYQNMLER